MFTRLFLVRDLDRYQVTKEAVRKLRGEEEKEREREESFASKFTLSEQFGTSGSGVRAKNERRSGTESRGLDNFSCPPSRKRYNLEYSKRRNEERHGHAAAYKVV